MGGGWPGLRRLTNIGMTWAFVWLLVFMSIVAFIGAVDPDSIDEGEILAAVVVLGPMGLLTGLAFALLWSIDRKAGTTLQPRLVRAASWGVLGTAVVQTLYLGHGDAGLAANVGMALMFCAVGGVVAIAWALGARCLASLRRHPGRSHS